MPTWSTGLLISTETTWLMLFLTFNHRSVQFLYCKNHDTRCHVLFWMLRSKKWLPCHYPLEYHIHTKEIVWEWERDDFLVFFEGPLAHPPYKGVHMRPQLPLREVNGVNSEKCNRFASSWWKWWHPKAMFSISNLHFACLRFQKGGVLRSLSNCQTWSNKSRECAV